MGLRSDSVAGVRFLAAVREGRGIKPAARSVGVHPWTGYRWLREAFLAHRCNGLSAEAAQSELGFFTAKALVWEEEFLAGLGDGRHHLRVRVEVEDIFWAHYGEGGSVSRARADAGVGQATAYRWLQARFIALRDGGLSRAAGDPGLGTSRAVAGAATQAHSATGSAGRSGAAVLGADACGGDERRSEQAAGHASKVRHPDP